MMFLSLFVFSFFPPRFLWLSCGVNRGCGGIGSTVFPDCLEMIKHDVGLCFYCSYIFKSMILNCKRDVEGGERSAES